MKETTQSIDGREWHKVMTVRMKTVTQYHPQRDFMMRLSLSRVGHGRAQDLYCHS